MNNEIKIEEILKLLPHRYPFILVDKVLNYELNSNLRALKNVTINEPFFQGHFPNNPVMPGVLIIEAMAQASAILGILSHTSKIKDNLIYLLTIEKAKFRQVVKPGDQLIFQTKILHKRNKFCKFEAIAYVDNNIVAEAELTAMIEEEV